MLVYRVQIPGTKISLYHNNNMWDIKDCMQSSDRHPSPDQDAALSGPWYALPYEQRKYYYFGFSTIAQLKSWIYQQNWRAKMDRAGFRVVVYDTTDYLIGDTQAVFRMQTASTMQELRLTEI